MGTMSYTQEYFLCAINGKGNVPLFRDVEVTVCLIAGGIMELIGSGYLVRDEKNKLVSGKDWDDTLSYLKPLYEEIVSSKKDRDAKGISVKYIDSDKKRNKLIASLGVSLLAEGCVEELENKGFLKNKTKYVPKQDAVTRVIEKVRAEFLEDGEVTEETTCLAALLERSGLIKDYFSKVESAKLKERIKQVRESDASATVNEMLDYIESLILLVIIATGAASVASQ